MTTEQKDQERYEIRLSGSGGQGLITAAVVFAEAVGVYDGKYVCQTQSYGPEARGGKSKAEVVISSMPIDYPKALELDLLLAMKDQGKTIFFCSHILSEVERLCDRIGILVDGNLQFLGTSKEFLDKWQATDLEEAFIQEAQCA